MPANIDNMKALGRKNPNAEKGTITIKPHRHHDINAKIEQTMIDIICIIDRDGLKTSDDCWGNSDCAVRLAILYLLRNNGNIVDATGKPISKKKLMKMIKDYLADKLPSEQRFFIEGIMREIAEEMLNEYRKACEEIANEEINSMEN